MKFDYFKSIIGTGENKEFLFPTLRICRIASGTFDWLIGTDQYPFKTGDVVLLNNLTPRRIVRKNSEMIQIDVFEFSPIEIQSRPSLLRAFYSAQPAIISSKNSTLIAPLLSDFTFAFSETENQAFFDHLMQAVFDLLDDMFHDSAVQTVYASTAFSAARFIWDHYEEELSVPMIAERLNISKNHLEKTFKQVHGMGVGAYIRAIRVYHAMSLMKSNPSRSVLEVAMTCGFGSSSGFYKAYKTVTGMKPKRK